MRADLTPTLLWVLVAAAAPALAPTDQLDAAENTLNDLRLDYSPLLGRDWRLAGPLRQKQPDAGIPDTSSAADFNQTVSTHTRVGLSFVHSLSDLEADRGAFLLGASVAIDRLETQGGSVDHSYLLDLFAGWAWAFTPSWHLEEGFILGGGQSHYRLHIHNWWSDTSDIYSRSTGPMYEYGLRIGTYYTFLEHAQIGLDLRYMVKESHLHFYETHRNASGNTDIADFHPSERVKGFGGMLNAGYRF